MNYAIGNDHKWLGTYDNLTTAIPIIIFLRSNSTMALKAYILMKNVDNFFSFFFIMTYTTRKFVIANYLNH